MRILAEFFRAFLLAPVGVYLAGATPLAAAEQKAASDTVTVFAAASLKNALDGAASAYPAETGKKVVVSYAASSALAKQIEEGAPADVFISADLDWMDYLEKAKLIDVATRANLLGNSLVLIAPASSTASIKIASGFDLSGALAGGRLAVADVKAVPAGKYAQAALEKLGVWASVANKLAPAENVRAALALVARGEAPLGIVYQTDAMAEPNVKIAGVFPADSHPAIIYPIAETSHAKSDAAARGFIAYLKSDKAFAIFAKQGFTRPK